MPWYEFVWNDEIVNHLAEHGVTQDEFEDVLTNGDPDMAAQSRSSDRLIQFGETAEGRRLACVYEMIDDITVLPTTAYDID
ncbi:hypothetical protein [Stratiformator vulcanicus]|uniref:DUF4258 domain-containing protein n=1 Tax=Stratiformator vulcanicus TaxID=2527980 RepID=A0A517R3R0_9PLAN|nr:hypothetical protein [Stratiformator vulcanicus]QDT38480.1 hypothetical protein Pan189_28740 [Stratiformator vulcanicus]